MERTPGGKKQYNMRMVSADDSVRLSGYEHNAGRPERQPADLPAGLKKKPGARVSIFEQRVRDCGRRRP